MRVLDNYKVQGKYVIANQSSFPYEPSVALESRIMGNSVSPPMTKLLPAVPDQIYVVVPSYLVPILFLQEINILADPSLQ